jgi:hypothetical protein
MKVEMNSTVEITPEFMAKLFCHMDDESQTQFFEAIGKYAEQSDMAYKMECQWYYLGGHLRDCKCSSGAGRRFIENLYDAMKTSTHT